MMNTISLTQDTEYHLAHLPTKLVVSESVLNTFFLYIKFL